MRRILFFSWLFIFLVGVAEAQDDQQQINCSQRLRIARATYAAGRLHELVGTILDATRAKTCFSGDVGAFSVQEKVEAYQLLTLAYIYLEEPLKADEAMLQLLRTDHFYKPNPASDPAEYLALYSTFRTEPVIAFGGKVGGSLTIPSILQNYYVASQSHGNGKYSPGVSFVGGFFAEKEFFPKAKMAVLRNSVLLGEAFFHLRPFKVGYTELWQNQNAPTPVPAATYAGKSKSSWLDLNLILRYRIKPASTYDPYIGIGPGFSYLANSKFDLAQTPRKNVDGNITATVTGPAIDVKPAYHTLAKSVIAMGGIKFRFGEIYINVETRFQFGLFNLIKPKDRTIPELAYNYGITINDYRQSNFILNAGVTYPYFNPKKKPKKK